MHKKTTIHILGTALMLTAAFGCGDGGSSTEVDVDSDASDTTNEDLGLDDVALEDTAAADAGDTADDTADDAGTDGTPVEDTVSADTSDTADTADTAEADLGPDGSTGTSDCEAVAANFGTRGATNENLPEPVSEATCDGDTVTVIANGIPDFTYIQTSPGNPREQELNISFPANPTFAANTTDIPLVGPMAITTAGIPIYGPTEGAGGDVLALGNLSDCGTHNGPGGFHMHLFGTSTTTDCVYTPEEAAAAPQLLGYAFDGFPIYTGNDQYTSSWVLSDESAFATDTWAAHTYVEGTGDLDECNGLVDGEGNYAYYTTDTFPYVMGCLAGEVTLVRP